MRRCALKKGGIILRWSAPKCFYTEGSFVAQDIALKSKSNPDDLDQLARNETHENTAQGLHTSLEHENGSTDTVKSSARRPLPLSPLMDPAYLAVKQKHRLPKEPPSKEPTPFQQQLARNPYAQALATPVRMCTLTRVHLPSFFLQDFDVIAHPSTNEPWYLPRSLTSPHSSVDPTEAEASPNQSQSAGIRHGPRPYILSRASLVKAIRTPRSGYTSAEVRFPTIQAKQWKAMNIKWRRDMDTFVLELMRRRVVEELKYLCGRKRGYLQGCSDWAYAKGCKQIGAFLWLGPRNRENGVASVGRDEIAVSGGGGNVIGKGAKIAVRAEESAASGEGVEKRVIKWEDAAAGGGKGMAQEGTFDVSPGEFATLDMSKEMKSKVPAHNLQLLLGDAYVEDLRQHLPRIFKYEVVALKNRKTTVDVQLRLWKLQGYLAEHKQADNE